MTCTLPARHLALVQPEATLGSSAVRIAAVAADFAASALAQRFAVAGSGGIDELVAASAAGALMSADDVLLPLVRLLQAGWRLQVPAFNKPSFLSSVWYTLA